MKKKFGWLLGVFAAIFLCFAGPWQPINFRLHQVGIIEMPHKKARLSVIGLDDQGNIEDSQSLLQTHKEIRTFRPKLLFIFVHGWQSDGSIVSQQSGELGRYRSFLLQTTKAFNSHPVLKKWHQERVMGVYLAWHGHTRSYLKSLTFWNRLSVARRLGKSPNVRKAVTEMIVKARKYRDRKSPVRVVLFAHSMGGQIVNGLLNQIDNPVAAHQNKTLPDLTLVLNPAAPKRYYERYTEKYRKQYPHRLQGVTPQIISIRSQADTTTSMFYPLSTFEDIIGHSYLTHRVKVTENPIQKTILCNEHDSAFVYNLACNQSNQAHLFRTNNRYYKLLPITDELTPYWVFRLPRTIVKNKTSFFDDDIIALTGSLLAVSQYQKQQRKW